MHQKVLYIASSLCQHGRTVSQISTIIEEGYTVKSITGDGQGGFLVLLEIE